MQKKLCRSRTNKTFSGVCGGLGEYLNIDPTIVRVLWVILSLFSAGFPGLIVYIVLAIVIPEAPEVPDDWQQQPYAPPPQQNWQQQGWQQQPPQGTWQQQPPQGSWQAPPQGTWQAPPPPAAQPVDYTQPAPPEPPIEQVTPNVPPSE